jgi:ribosomal protein S15P/S13E
MKSLAYWDRVLIKDIVNMEEHIARHEKKRTVKRNAKEVK